MSKTRLAFISGISIALVTGSLLPCAAAARPKKKPQTCLASGCIWSLTTSQGQNGIFQTQNHHIKTLHAAMTWTCKDGSHTNFVGILPTKIDASGNFSASQFRGTGTFRFSGKITGKTAVGRFSFTGGPPGFCSGNATWKATAGNSGTGGRR